MKSARQSRIIISSRTRRRTGCRSSSSRGSREGREWLRFLEMMLTKPGRSVKVAAINVFQVDAASGDSHSQRFMSNSQEGVCECVCVCARVCCVANLRLNQMQMHFKAHLLGRPPAADLFLHSAWGNCYKLRENALRKYKRL